MMEINNMQRGGDSGSHWSNKKLQRWKEISASMEKLFFPAADVLLEKGSDLTVCSRQVNAPPSQNRHSSVTPGDQVFAS